MEKRKTRRAPKTVPPGNPEAGMLGDEPPLSAQLAFVVQFRKGAGQVPKAFAGRVEHMATYQATRFANEAELLAFLHSILQTQHTDAE